MKKISFAVLFAFAVSTAPAMAHEVYGQVGTEGFGIGYTYPITPAFNVRGEVNHFAKSYEVDSDENTYKGDLKLGGVSILMDYFPLGSSLRLTAGLISNAGKITGTATGENGSYTFNGNTYSASANDSVTAKVKLGNVNPYFGFGVGHESSSMPGVSFFADMGVIFQKPKVELSVSGNLSSSVSAADLESERRKLQDSVDKFRAYPVIKFGVAYRF